MPIPSEKPATAGQKTFSAPKNAGQQASPVKSKNLDLQVIPLLVKHMTLAIYDHKFGGVDGRTDLNTKDADRTSKSPKRRSNFAEAFAIARGRLVDFRHLSPSSKEGPVGKITLTSSGRQLDMNHKREAGGAKKTKRFDMLYEKYMTPHPVSVPEKRNDT